MSATRPKPQHLVALSLTLYRALLILYPRRFRDAYAGQMAQVFRDSLRTAAREHGIVGIARVWGVTLPDLLLTALAERAERTESSMPITRSALYRATGLISLAGIPVWFLSFLGMTFVSGFIFNFYIRYSPSMSTFFPTAWVFFAIGFIGLYAWLAAHRGALVWLPGVVILAALLAMIAGGVYLGWASQVGVSYSGPYTIVDWAARSAVNKQLNSYADQTASLGYPIVGLALVATAWMTHASPGLRRVSRTLLVMGVVSAIVYFFTNMGAPSLLTNTGQGMEVLVVGRLIFAAVWMVGWLLLGRWLWRAGGAQGQAAAASATPPE